MSFLAPYSNFDEFEAEARRLWSIFLEHFAPGPPTRAALRYINRLNLPLPFNDFSEFVLTIPEIAPGLPQGLAGFSMRLLVPDIDSNRVAIITEVLEEQTEEHISLIFDIDAFQVLENVGPDFDLWSVVADLREYKNKIFFGSVTPKLLRLFD